MKLISQDVFVKIKDKLPEESGRYYTDGHRGVDFYKKGNCGFDDDANWWLDSRQGYFFTEDELKELLKKIYDGVAQNVGTCVKREELPSSDEYVNSLLEK